MPIQPLVCLASVRKWLTPENIVIAGNLHLSGLLVDLRKKLKLRLCLRRLEGALRLASLHSPHKPRV